MAHAYLFVWNNIDAIYCTLFYIGKLNNPAAGSAAHEQMESVQSTLSNLQSPPEQMQSQCNYVSFLSKSHLHDTIL